MEHPSQVTASRRENESQCHFESLLPAQMAVVAKELETSDTKKKLSSSDEIAKALHRMTRRFMVGKARI